MKRANAFTLVTRHGGKPCERVTKNTSVVIVGELGWPLQEDGRPSKSLTQAKSYGVPIVSERRFLEWVGKISPEEQAKAYTTDELAALSKLPTDVVEQLSMFGLIEVRLRLSRSRRRSSGRAAPWFWDRAFGDHKEPARDPEMAPRCAAFEPAPVSGIKG
jgi:hypothetical protein